MKFVNEDELRLPRIVDKDMTIPIGSSLQNFAYPSGYVGPSKSQQNGDAQFSSALDQALKAFTDVAFQTPAERARKTILQKHNLDDRGYAAPDADAKKAIDQDIVEAVKRTTGSLDPASGSPLG